MKVVCKLCVQKNLGQGSTISDDFSRYMEGKKESFQLIVRSFSNAVPPVKANISRNNVFKIVFTRKYPLRGYILGVLKHTTALDQLWGGNEFLKLGSQNELYSFWANSGDEF